MYFAHAASTPSAAPGSDLPLVVCFIVLTLGVAIVAARTLRADRRRLRVCPVCAAVAVRATAAEEAGSGRVRLGVQCGQCGTWRRAVASEPDVEAYERALKRDRRRIGDDAVRLVRKRARRDLEAFVRALRYEVRGADDFLARARRSGASAPPSGLGRS